MNKPLTLDANNLTAIASCTASKAFRITPKPFLPERISILKDALTCKIKATNVIYL